jgi:hypothetical protein
MTDFFEARGRASTTDANRPSRRRRFAIALLIGAMGTLVHYTKFRLMPSHPGDFGLSWFGARALLHGVNPYELVGPGRLYDWPWPLVYPATAFVAAMPLAILPQLVATLIFVFVSCALLAYSVTGRDWARLPMFGSAAFIVASGAAQWSPLFTAAMGIPVLGFFFAAKPTIGLALGGAGDPSVQKFALIGGAALTVTSLVFLPDWPRLWVGQLHYATQMAAPLTRLGGVFVLLALLRWRRPEARLVLFLACVPQVGSWYDMLPLFLVPFTSRESMTLATVSSLGFVLHYHFGTTRSEFEFNQQGGALMVALGYLPAVIMVLRRPNDGKLPPWLTRIADRIASLAGKTATRT